MKRLVAKTAAAGGFGLAFGLPLSTLKAKERVPAFTLDAPFYDQSRFAGRLMGVLDKIDPRTLLISEGEVKRCQSLLEDFTRTKQLPNGLSDEDMWSARKTVEAVIHPVTKEPMFPAGRMSAFLPMNVPICALMLNARTVPLILLSQWLNQSYNVMNNYVNRSSLEVDWLGLLRPYALAVTVSCGIALGASRALRSSPSLARLGLFVPYAAVVSAGSCNVAFTRMDEWSGRGICVVSPEGRELGMSVRAGQQAVLSTVSTRSCCLPIPVLLVPPLVMSLLPVSGALAVLAEGLVIIVCMGVALPCALAMLPQEMEIPVSSLEPKFQKLVDSAGKPILSVFANKGL